MPIVNKERYNLSQMPESPDIKSPFTNAEFFLSSKIKETRGFVIERNKIDLTADSNSVQNNRNQSHSHDNERPAAISRVFMCVYVCACECVCVCRLPFLSFWFMNGYKDVYLCSILCISTSPVNAG